MLAETARRAHDKGLTVLRGHAVEGGRTYRPIAEALVGHLRGAKELPRQPRAAPVPARAGPARAGHRRRPRTGRRPGRRPRRSRPAAAQRPRCRPAPRRPALGRPGHAGRPRLRRRRRCGPPGADRRHRPRKPTPAPRDADPTHQARRQRGPGDGRGTGRQERCRKLVARADGLPFLVEELLQSGPDVPPTFAALVDDRLRTLSPEARRFVHEAAIAGPDQLHPQRRPRAKPSTRTCSASKVDDHALTWRHALTREAVLAQLLPPETGRAGPTTGDPAGRGPRRRGAGHGRRTRGGRRDPGPPGPARPRPRGVEERGRTPRPRAQRQS